MADRPPMKPEDVPDELVKLFCDTWWADSPSWSRQITEHRQHAARVVLAVVLPAYEATVRAKAPERIEPDSGALGRVRRDLLPPAIVEEIRADERRRVVEELEAHAADIAGTVDGPYLEGVEAAARLVEP